MLFSSDKKITFKVTGMHCINCKAKCERAVLAIESVTKAVADNTKDSLIVKVSKDAGDSISEKIILAVEGCGFKAELK